MYVVRKRALGDALWAEPVIRELAKKNSKVIFYTKIPELFENYDLQNVIIKNKLKFWEHAIIRLGVLLGLRKIAIDLEMAYEKRPKMHMLHAYQEEAGLPKQKIYPRINLFPNEFPRDLILPKKYALIHVESTAPRNYRKISGVNWNKITAVLEEKGYTVIQIGINPEPMTNAKHFKTSISEMIALIANASLFIGIDSGPSHIAASLRTPCILFFGAVLPEYRHFKELFNGIILQNNCPYLGCYHEIISKSGPECKLAPKQDIAPCSIYTSEKIIQAINKLELKND